MWLKTMKICYFDIFRKHNSNTFWLKALRQYGKVMHYDLKRLRRTGWETVLCTLKKWQPNHIHFGGSAKTNKVLPLDVVKELRRLCAARITFFYGDHGYPLHHMRCLPYVDKIFVTNMCYEHNPKFKFMLHPGAPEVFFPLNLQKEGVVFIGNNVYTNRQQALEALGQSIHINTYGKGWNKTSLFTKGPVSLSDSNYVYNSHAIALGDVSGDICRNSSCGKCVEQDPDECYTGNFCQQHLCRGYEPLVAYLSNRPTNIMLTGTMCLTMYRQGFERVFRNRHHIVWAHNTAELIDLVNYYLRSKPQRQEIAQVGRQLVMQQHTFLKAAARILEE